MSTTTIDKKITGYSVVDDKQDSSRSDNGTGKTATSAELSSSEEPVTMHENVDRPESLTGSTYKIKTPLSDHALYITINDIVLNPGTEHQRIQPFEIFINSKNLEHFQWVVALTRVISAVFRKGGDITFLVEELKAVFDPTGGYFKSGGVFMPSLVAEIGSVIETHLRSIGLLQDDGLSTAQRNLLEDKKKQYLDQQKDNTETVKNSGFPSDASLCFKCHNKAIIIMDGCKTCLNCGDSKCG